jgi:hypothetical protein
MLKPWVVSRQEVRMSRLLLVSLCLGGCQEVSLSVRNTAPEVQILAPADGGTVQEGKAVGLFGTFNDPDGRGDVEVEWTVDDRVACAVATRAARSEVSCDAALTPGDHAIGLRVWDAYGAMGFDSVVVTVVPSGAPSATVLSPDSGTRLYAEVPFELSGLVRDDEDAPVDMEVWWQSEGGEDFAVSVDVAGRVSGTGSLPEGIHQLVLGATDTSGKQDTDGVAVTVGAPNSGPSCAIEAPTEGAFVARGQPVELVAVSLDPDQPASELAVVWSSDRAGEVAVAHPDDDGHSQGSWAPLVLGEDTLTLTVTDELGAYCTATTTMEVAEAPAVVITSPHMDGVFAQAPSVELVGSVQDDRPLSELDVRWTLSTGEDLGGSVPDASGWVALQAALPVGPAEVVLTAVDGHGLVGRAVARFTLDGRPNAPVVSIRPASPQTGDTLRAHIEVDSVDPEGAEVAYRYTWWLGAELQTEHEGAEVPDEWTAKGDDWRVEVHATDGLQDGGVGEAFTTVVNTPPTASATLPAEVSTAVDLLCTAATADADRDVVEVSYGWWVDGLPVDGEDSEWLSWEHTRPGTEVWCGLTPWDGEAFGKTAFAEAVVLENTAPGGCSVELTPEDPRVTDDLDATATGAEDAEGDLVFYTYTWKVDDAPVAEERVDGPTLDAGVARRGEWVRVRATPSDGRLEGTPCIALVEVLNTPPTLDEVWITPEEPFVGELLTAHLGAWADADGDAVSFSYAWFSGEEKVHGEAGPTLDPEARGLNRDLPIKVTVTPSDPEPGAEASDSVTVQNSPPTAPVVTLSPEDPEGLDELVCGVSEEAFDPDGDAIAYVFEWLIDGHPLLDWSEPTLPADFTWPGQEITCLVRASDGYDEGPAAEATVTVADAIALSVAVQVDHGCALTSAGQIDCWGNNDNRKAEAPNRGVVYTEVTVGKQFSCALNDEGGAECWGLELEAPPEVALSTIDAGQEGVCGLDLDGAIHCWGTGEPDAPYLAAPEGAFVDVSWGKSHGCAVAEAGEVQCWGIDTVGQAPAVVDDGTFESVSAGHDHSCGVLRGGRVTCWGNGGSKSMPPAGTFQEVSAGETHTCGLQSGDVTCWGADIDPLAPGLLWVDVALGARFHCGVTTEGDVRCAGESTRGQAPEVAWAP